MTDAITKIELETENDLLKDKNHSRNHMRKIHRSIGDNTPDKINRINLEDIANSPASP